MTGKNNIWIKRRIRREEKTEEGSIISNRNIREEEEIPSGSEEGK